VYRFPNKLIIYANVYMLRIAAMKCGFCALQQKSVVLL